jgi:hypothetical protein
MALGWDMTSRMPAKSSGSAWRMRRLMTSEYSQEDARGFRMKKGGPKAALIC